MKKITLFVMSILMIAVVGVLTACDWKKVEATFTESEVVVSLQPDNYEDVSLDDYLVVKGVDKSQVDYVISDPDIFKLNSRRAEAIKSGKTYVYAKYKNNSLAKMLLVAQKNFEAPTEFVFTETGLLKWNKVANFFENEKTPTYASRYSVKGTLTVYSTENPTQIEKTEVIDQIVTENQIQLTKNGEYNLVVKALSDGYFDDSENSQEQKLYLGYMQALETDDLNWNASLGTLSWTAVAGAKYQVLIDENLIGQKQSQTSKDLTTILKNADDGLHRIGVVVFDNQNKKMASYSEEILIEKFFEPDAEYVYSSSNGGQIRLKPMENVEKFKLVFENVGNGQKVEKFYMNNGQQIDTAIEGLAEGIYNLSVCALNETGNYFESDQKNIGKVYKLGTISLQGKGDNEENGREFNFVLNGSAADFGSRLKVYGLSDVVDLAGLDAGSGTADLSLRLSNEGRYTLSAVLMPTQRKSLIGGEEMFVLNSDQSQAIEVVKVAQFTQEVVHSYQDNKSELAFEMVEGATSYELCLHDGTQYNLIETVSSVGKFVFDDKIENLFETTLIDGEKVFKFKVVAKTADDKLAINSSIEKTIALLPAPVTANSGNSTDKTYRWTAVNGAGEYRIEVFNLDKSLYEQNKERIELDVSQMTASSHTVESSQYTFEEVGYYYAQVYSVSTDVNNYISSLDYMQEIFYIAEKLQLSSVNFGFDKGYINDAELTESTGYFVSVGNVEHSNRFEFNIGSTKNATLTKMVGMETIYLLTEDFSQAGQAIEISVLAHAEDDVLYVQSDEKVITIEKLTAVNFADNIIIDDLTSTVSVKPKEGASEIKIYENDKNYISAPALTNVSMNIADRQNFSLQFTYVGSNKIGNFFEENDGKIYLSSDVSQYNFKRLATPTNFQYYDGDLTFEHADLLNTQYYVLDIICVDAVNNETKLTIKFDTKVDKALKVVYNGEEHSLSNSLSDFIVDTASPISIDFARILSLVKGVDALSGLSDIYNQSVSIKFAVYGYQIRNDANEVLLSSTYSTLAEGEGDELEVKKMNPTTLSFSYETTDENKTTGYTLIWQDANSNFLKNSESVYDIYKVEGENQEFVKTVKESLNMLIADEDLPLKNNTYYTYFLRVRNPYYLESADSNLLRIYKLRPISSVTLSGNELVYSIPNLEQEFCSHVDVSINKTTSQDATGRIAVGDAGSYVLKVVGKTNVESFTTNGQKVSTYYINSNTSTWTLKSMEELKPTDVSILYNSGLVSWNKYAETSSLDISYYAIFKDKDGKTVTAITKDTSLNLNTNVSLFDKVGDLSAGSISVGVSAFIDSPYQVLAGGNVYYALSATLLDGSVEHNHYNYTSNNSIIKLTTPEITDFEFVYDELENAQSPDLQISFVGNYESTAQVNVYLDDELILGNQEISKQDEKYTFTIENKKFNNTFVEATTKNLKISVVSGTAFPSSAGTAEILRALPVKDIKFVENDLGISTKIEILFDAIEGEEQYNYLVGGVVVKADYSPNEGDAKTEYFVLDIETIGDKFEVDLASCLDANLVTGGQVKLTVYVNNYSNVADGRYILSSPTYKESASYNVLTAIKEENLGRQSGGFVINSSNGEETTYKIECQGTEYAIDKTDEFYFEFPNDWANGEYTLSITAMQEGYIQSSKTEVEFELNRIASVTEVTLQRADADDLSNLTLSWDAITDASGYILKMYAKSDTDRANILYQFEGTKTAVEGKVSYSLEEIFGYDYENVSSEVLLLLKNDLEVCFDLTTIGNENYNNSHVYNFYATIKGNDLKETDVSIDEFGNIVFNSQEGDKYLYRFVGTDGTQIQAWKEVVATAEKTLLELETDEDGKYPISAGTLFNVEIIVMGTATTTKESTSTDYDFTFDSIPMTTWQTEVTFVINDEIESIGYYKDLPSSLAFTLLSAESFTKLYVGLEVDAITKGEVVGFVPEEQFGVENSISVVFSHSITELIDQFDKEDLKSAIQEGKLTLYFWSYRETETSSYSCVVSPVYTYSIGYGQTAQLEEVLKLGIFEGMESIPEDYEDFADTYAVFANADTTELSMLGVFVKVTQISAGQDVEIETAQEAEKIFSTIKFFSKEQLMNKQYFEDKLALNLTKDVFEDTDLLNMTGTFAVEFSTLQIKTITEGTEIAYQFVLSSWMSQLNDFVFEFERLPEVHGLKLSEGNLYWESVGEKIDKYYVYFAEEVKGEKLGEYYTYYPTTKTYFDASSYVGEKAYYYVAVQSISENLSLISSKRTYIMTVKEEELVPKQIYKNQIISPLTIQDGAFVINWADGDFYQLIAGIGEYENYSFAETGLALGKNIFASPFTFTLTSLLNNDVNVRFRFTPINSGTQGIRKVYDVDAKYLLADFEEFFNSQALGITLEERLNQILNASFESTSKDLINKFKEEVIDVDYHGVATPQHLFDDHFESLQLGDYQLEYCLLGGSSTLSSIWYPFENVDEKNVVYVNAEPSVKAEKVFSETDKALNSYRLYIKKSQLYGQNGEKITAEHYVVKITNDASASHIFEIKKDGTSYYLSSISDANKKVTVYQTDASGNIDATGEYLMFYLNINSGDSLLGVFGEDIEKRTYKMQIYAVGNQYSLSSKSEIFNITFFGFGKDLSVNNGEITWSPQINHPTSVIYKSNVELIEVLTEVSGASVTSRYSLNGLGSGLYDYIKFVMIGDVRGNTILVDSEIYQINNVYKLSAPTLSNTKGYIAIAENNTKILQENCYSSGNLYSYKLYNNISSESSYILFDGTDGGTVYYEPGVTNVEPSNKSDLAYKETEELANEFFVSSLGTNATLENRPSDNTNYHLRTIYIPNAEGKSIALKSEFGSIKARMMDVPSDIYVENGVLKWSAVEGKTGDQNFTIAQDDQTKVVYKVTVTQYKEKSEEEVDTNAEVSLDYYTTNTYFDFAQIKPDQLKNTDYITYLKATVQALALQTSLNKPNATYLDVDDGFGYGNVQFEATEEYVLIGNGISIDKIDRLAPIVSGSLNVSVDGKLTWQYETTREIEEANFINSYSFEVRDENEKLIEGEFSITLISNTEDTNTFQIVFLENKGEMLAGEQTLKVYATQGKDNNETVIKSFAEEKMIYKLPTIVHGDFEIISEDEYEILDFTKYFEVEGNELNLIDVIISAPEQKILRLDKNATQLFIYKEYSNDVLQDALYIGETGSMAIKFVVKKDYPETINTLYSDESEEFVLQRTAGINAENIEWNTVDQKFTWTYEGARSISSAMEVPIVELKDVLSKDTELYIDEQLSESAQITLLEENQVVVIEKGEIVSKISHNDAEYYISSLNITSKYIKTGTQEIFSGELIKIVEQKEDTSIITIDDISYFEIETNLLTDPIFIVEATYGEDQNSQIVRTYTTTKMEFTPTIIGQVTISIKVKIGNANLQSKVCQYKDESGEVKFETFNLFANGDGTASSPYQIDNVDQFKNISKRMSKDSVLHNYIQNRHEFSEETQFHFVINQDIDMTGEQNQFTGVLFEGTFDGAIDGANVTVSYLSKGVSKLSSCITVAEGNVLGPNSNSTSTTYNYASALFESFSSNATVKNLNISAKFGNFDNNESTTISNSALIAGLVVSNSGSIENVNLVGFESNFAGYVGQTVRLMMVYSGIASINTGASAKISQCSVLTDMEITDYNYAQLIFLSGIVYTNYAVVENCTMGQEVAEGASLRNVLKVECNKSTSTIQIAGVAITSTRTSILRGCVNNSNIWVYVPAQINQNDVYIGYIAACNDGTRENNINYGELIVENTPGNLKQEQEL